MAKEYNAERAKRRPERLTLGHAKLCYGNAEPEREIEFLLRKLSFRSRGSVCDTGRLRVEVSSQQRIKRRDSAVPTEVTQKLQWIDTILRKG